MKTAISSGVFDGTFEKLSNRACKSKIYYRRFAINSNSNPLNMAINKKSEFGEAENAVADFAKALGHPARVAILKVLAQRATCICGEIVEVLPLAQSTVSQHLKELQKAGLVAGTVDGAKSCYCINWENFARFEQIFHSFFEQANQQRCC